MTEYLQHQERLDKVISTVNEAILELRDAHAQAAEAQTSADPAHMRHAQEKLKQAEKRGLEAKESLLAEANNSQEQQVVQPLQELENAIANARQY